jgi:ATP-dependent DNA ligase
MQCKPVTALSDDEKSIFEIKFDGYRCIAVKRGREVTLFSRKEKVLNKRFPKVAQALASLGGDLVLDGAARHRIGSIYEAGERLGASIKYRTDREQEFVIGGYIPGAHRFDALLVGVYENKELIFVAKVKDGFVPRIRDEILPAVKKLSVVHCPFKNLPEKSASRWGESLTAEKMNQCRWVKPNLVCKVAFVEWTDAGHLRHCTFVAMRDDKKPTEVVRET